MINKITIVVGFISTIFIYIFGYIKGKKNEITKENENVSKKVQEFNKIKQSVMRYSDSNLDNKVQKFNKARDKVNK